MKKYIFLIMSCFLAFVFCSCSGENKEQVQWGTENKAIYKNDNNGVENIYLTVTKGAKNSLDDINGYRFDEFKDNLKKPSVKVVFSTVENSAFDSLTKYNAIIEPKGRSNAPQKSVKIKLMDSAGLWHDQKILSLDKSSEDISRVRNKLALDYLRDIPDYFSLRTQFCHVYIRDLNLQDAKFVDYGLFTHVESVNKTYFRSHEIMENGYAYEAVNFNFERNSNILKNTTDKGYSKTEFEKILEIQGEENNERLLKMLDDVNNFNLNINDIISTHFDRNNYITWLATNILMGNYESNTKSFFLVSPITENKWYFIPKTYDKAWNFAKKPKEQNKYASWQQEGISNYCGVVLHKRFLQDKKNVEDLTKKIEELSDDVFTENKTEKMLSEYKKTTEKFIKSVPDVKYLDSTLDYYEKDFQNILSTIEESKNKYYKSIKMPMPIFLKDAKKEANVYKFNWDKSYDFSSKELTYEFKLSTAPDMKNIIKKESLKGTSTTVKDLKPGNYYWTVEVKNSAGMKQIPFDKYKDEYKVITNGVKEVTIN